MSLTLINTSDMPPGGYAFRQAAINFDVPPHSELALMGLSHVAHALQQARINNPAAGLNPDIVACIEDVKAFQCARLAHKPKVLEVFCGERAGGQAQSVYDPGKPVGKQGGCKSCGKRR